MAQYISAMRHGKVVIQNELRPYYSKEKWDESSVPDGAIFLYESDTCPAGYDKVSISADGFLIAGTEHSDNAGGSATHTHTTTGHTHTCSSATTDYNSAYIQWSDGGFAYADGTHYHTISYATSSSTAPNLASGSYNNILIQPHRLYVLCKKI